MVPTLRGLGLGRVGGILMLGWWHNGHYKAITGLDTGHLAGALQPNPASACYKDVDPRVTSRGAMSLILGPCACTALQERSVECLNV